MKKLLLLTILLCSSLLCQAQKERPILGDEQTAEYFPILKGKRIAIFFQSYRHGGRQALTGYPTGK